MNWGNIDFRSYQHDIVKSCLFENTLVCLPTGLGKTFIAAVVMYNFYRWYPQAGLRIRLELIWIRFSMINPDTDLINFEI